MTRPAPSPAAHGAGAPLPPTPHAAGEGARVTPMMAQYLEIKAANPGLLLFYRMGDFYELFFDDAEVASRALGIMLTKRGKHLGEDIPMCGVPVERADEYLHRLIALGHRVAVCEQMEDPAEAKKRGAKSVVRRDVVRLVTPGTLTEDSLLEARANNYLLAIIRVRASSEADRYGLAWLDMSTADFHVCECGALELPAHLARIAPTEIICADTLFQDEICEPLLRAHGAVTSVTRDVTDSASAARRLADFFAIATADAFGPLSRAELGAAAACVTYVERTQVGKRPILSPPAREQAGATMAIDAATRANLEIMKTLSGERHGSLLHAIDETVTPAGSRLLAQRLAAPLTDVPTIRARHDALDALLREPDLRTALRTILRAAPDFARALVRISLERGGPRDLSAIGEGIAAAREAAEALGRLRDAPRKIRAMAEALLAPDPGLAEALGAALADELPASKRDGGFVRNGFMPAIDELRALRDQSRQVIAQMQARYGEATDIRTLKIRHNNVLGYFVEVTSQHADKLMGPPHNADFIHRQTLAGQVRFTTTELGEIEAKIASAGERVLGLEQGVFADLCAKILAQGEQLRTAAEAFAEIDVTTALAELAHTRAYVRPLIDDSLNFSIEGGRHPVVEAALRREGARFIANDCDLSPQTGETDGRIWIVTGPNMAGKSTFLRQNALIALLAQAGLFVPAKRAHIGVIDRLFSRVGAADDLARGRSTFMVEMVETAAILNQAGARALVILDEIGRGTATFDGLSIAWASIEHLHQTNRCRALFATHYHELTALAARLPRLFNATVQVREWDGEVVFLHEVIAGAADRSYGIQVARLAGLPKAVIARAQSVLTELEAEDRSRARHLVNDLPLFAATNPAPPEAAPIEAPLRKALEAIEPDQLSPREALEALYALKARLAEIAAERPGASSSLPAARPAEKDPA